MTINLYAQRLKTKKERFEEKFIVSSCDCWIWTGSDRCKDGYGGFGIGRKVFLAHRVSYEIYIGPIPNGLQVLHKCDIPACVNPDHLFVGTIDDNQIDKAIKGRAQKKLIPDQVRSIRNDDRTMKVIGEDYGVSAANICNIKKRNAWKHII